MFSVYFSWRELVSMAAVLGVCLIPVITATVLTFRSFRRGWWLAGPGGLFVVMAPLVLFLFDQLGAMRRDDGPAFGISMAMIVGAWISLGLFLAVLAIVGPKLPALDVGEVF